MHRVACVFAACSTADGALPRHSGRKELRVYTPIGSITDTARRILSSPIGADCDERQPKQMDDNVKSDSTDELDFFGLTWDALSVVPDTPAVTPSTGAKARGVDCEDEEGEGVEAKRQKRMLRNRESAAMSRARKKRHVEELERKLAMLSTTVAMLQAENDALRAGARGVDAHPPKELKQMTNTAAPPMPSCSPVSVAADFDDSSLVLFAQELTGGISVPNSPAALFGDAGGGDDSVPLLHLNSAVCPTPKAHVACAG